MSFKKEKIIPCGCRFKCRVCETLDNVSAYSIGKTSFYTCSNPNCISKVKADYELYLNQFGIATVEELVKSNILPDFSEKISVPRSSGLIDKGWTVKNYTVIESFNYYEYKNSQISEEEVDWILEVKKLDEHNHYFTKKILASDLAKYNKKYKNLIKNLISFKY